MVPMSLTEILAELPHLSPKERSLLCRCARAIDEAENVAAVELSAAEGFGVLSRRKGEDAVRRKGE